MITLNLLDPQLQRKLHQERLLILWRDSMALSLAGIAVIGISFVISRSILVQDFHATLERINIISSRNQPVAHAIRELNQSILSVSGVQEEYYPWSAWLISFSEVVPEGDEIRSITLDQITKKVRINGKSRHRDDLLKFKVQLEQSGLVKDLVFPLSNLLLKNNIDFEFTADIVMAPPIASPHSVE